MAVGKTAKRITGAGRDLALTKECQNFLRFLKKFETTQVVQTTFCQCMLDNSSNNRTVVKFKMYIDADFWLALAVLT